MANLKYFEGQRFNKLALRQGVLEKAEYENCIFSLCDLSGCDLRDSIFIDCEFEECDLSAALVHNAAFREVTFAKCKLHAIRFEECSKMLLAFSFSDCELIKASFYNLKLKNLQAKGCSFLGADLGYADLTGGVFDRCDFDRAIFDNTNLEKADLKTSYNYIIDPANNRITNAKFSIHGLPGLLTQYNLEIV